VSWTGFFVIAVFGVALGTWAFDLGRDGASGSRTRVAFAAGEALLVAYVIWRWAVTDHPPVRGMVEGSVAAATVLMGVCVFAMWRGRAWSDVAVASSSPWVLIAATASLWFSDAPVGLRAGERSALGYGHAALGWASFAALVVAVGCGVMLLVRSYAPHKTPTWIPAGDRLSHWAQVSAAWGFALLTANMAAGVLFGLFLFGTSPRLEIVQAGSIGLWLACGGLVHARMHFRWRGAAQGWLALALVPFMILSFWGGSIVRDTYHDLDRPVVRAGAVK
jgi:ABC-type uncharacterized transport system permease subunit